MNKREVKDNKVCFVIVYFGNLPAWFPAFLLSCKCNPNIDWLIFTDSRNYLDNKPDNVAFNKLEFHDFKRIASELLGVEMEFTNPHKLCDFKPMYGLIFSDYLKTYNYWGHCDLDLIWGDIESFLCKISFSNYGIISTRKQSICGHFTLYRNEERLNLLFSEVRNYKKIFDLDKYCGFDEGFFAYHLYQSSLKADFPYKLYWPKKHGVDWPELKIKPYGWHWSEGKILDNKGRERLYLHFMKWKKSLKLIDFKYDDEPQNFKITKYGIWSGRMDLISALKYLFPGHIFKRTRNGLGKLKKRILKTPDFEGPIIPEGYKVIE